VQTASFGRVKVEFTEGCHSTCPDRISRYKLCPNGCDDSEWLRRPSSDKFDNRILICPECGLVFAMNRTEREAIDAFLEGIYRESRERHAQIKRESQEWLENRRKEKKQ